MDNPTYTEQEQKMLTNILELGGYPICFHALGQPLVELLTDIIRKQNQEIQILNMTLAELQAKK